MHGIWHNKYFHVSHHDNFSNHHDQHHRVFHFCFLLHHFNGQWLLDRQLLLFAVLRHHFNSNRSDTAPDFYFWFSAFLMIFSVSLAFISMRVCATSFLIVVSISSSTLLLLSVPFFYSGRGHRRPSRAHTPYPSLFAPIPSGPFPPATPSLLFSRSTQSPFTTNPFWIADATGSPL